MKKYSQFHQVVSLSLIFALLVTNSGCVGSKVLSSSNLPVPGYNSYKIHVHNSFYLISNCAVINGRLSGKLDSVAPRDKKSIIHIYLTSDTVIKIKSGNILSIPIESVKRVEQPKFSILMTSLLIGGFVLAIVLFLNSYTLGFNPFPNGLI